MSIAFLFQYYHLNSLTFDEIWKDFNIKFNFSLKNLRKKIQRRYSRSIKCFFQTNLLIALSISDDEFICQKLYQYQFVIQDQGKTRNLIISTQSWHLSNKFKNLGSLKLLKFSFLFKFAKPFDSILYIKKNKK